MSKEFCDDCGDLLGLHIVIFAVLPFNVSSANKGESGCICGACHKKHLDSKYWESEENSK